jgi:hypothetical protein
MAAPATASIAAIYQVRPINPIKIKSEHNGLHWLFLIFK